MLFLKTINKKNEKKIVANSVGNIIVTSNEYLVTSNEYLRKAIFTTIVGVTPAFFKLVVSHPFLNLQLQPNYFLPNNNDT
tara:strand:+ start:499 stop:738 length:240 start_codon:yes stop_codon:yes gene_type:complete